jgi:hypothetical protein
MTPNHKITHSKHTYNTRTHTDTHFTKVSHLPIITHSTQIHITPNVRDYPLQVNPHYTQSYSYPIPLVPQHNHRYISHIRKSTSHPHINTHSTRVHITFFHRHPLHADQIILTHHYPLHTDPHHTHSYRYPLTVDPHNTQPLS